MSKINADVHKPSLAMLSEWIPAIVAGAVLALAIVLRANKHAIALNDALIALTAGAFILLSSGKIAKLVIGQKGVTIETVKQAFLDSAKEPIAEQVTELPPFPKLLPVEVIQDNPKGPLAEYQI